MTALAPNQPFIRWSPFLGLWVAYRYGSTGDDHFEAAEIWAVIFENPAEVQRRLAETGGVRRRSDGSPIWPA